MCKRALTHARISTPVWGDDAGTTAGVLMTPRVVGSVPLISNTTKAGHPHTARTGIQFSENLSSLSGLKKIRKEVAANAIPRRREAHSQFAPEPRLVKSNGFAVKISAVLALALPKTARRSDAIATLAQQLAPASHLLPTIQQSFP